MNLDFDHCYRAIQSRDPRFDGHFFTAVLSTGIYCRPICPARTPKPANVRFFSCAAAAEAAGFRACRRCRPDTCPGSPDWDVRADLVARALRLIAAGTVDLEGVEGVARRLAVSARHLHRELMAEVGTGALALARTRRAQTARLLIDQTTLPLTEIAFAAGFASIRQFNETLRASFGCNPTALRRRHAPVTPGSGSLVVHLACRGPLAAGPLLSYLARHAVPGVEEVDADGYRRTVALPHSHGVIALQPAPHGRAVLLRAELDDLRDLSMLVSCCRQMLDLDADPAGIDNLLAADPLLAPLVAVQPGMRVPGAFSGFEAAVRTIVGQQVSVEGARTLLGRLVARLGRPLEGDHGTLVRLFPTPEILAAGDLTGLGLTAARCETLRTVASAVLRGELVLDRGADRAETETRLLGIRGIGPWTAAAIAMRALGDPDAWPAADRVLRQALVQRGVADTAEAIAQHAESWRPWRAYAAHYLWAAQTRARTPPADAQTLAAGQRGSEQIAVHPTFTPEA